MAKLWAILNLFRRGAAVADPAAWKNGQITVNALVLLLGALVATARSLGYDLPISDTTLAQLAAGLLGLVNSLLTVTTSKTIGLPPAPGTEPDRSADTPRNTEPAAAPEPTRVTDL